MEKGRPPYASVASRQGRAGGALTEGLLPEGEARAVIEDRLGVRREDTFGLRCEVRWMELASPTTGEVLRIEAVTPVALHMSTTHFTADDCSSPATRPI